MVATPLVLLAVLAQRPKDQYTLGYRDDHFVVRNGAKDERVARDATPKPRGFLSFRSDRRWAVWDKRGLTVRDADWSFSDRLESIPTSPKFQEKDAIRATLAQVKAGRRKLAANALSGARRIGKNVYFLPRWEDAGGKPWLEALVAVDLSKPRPKPRLLGIFPGISLGKGLIDDRLGIQNGRLAVVVNGDDAWGLATYDPAKGTFAFDERGIRLVALEGDRAIEKTEYGTLVVGRREGGRTVPWLELRGNAEFVPGEGTVLVRSGSRLRNAETGAEFRLARRAAVRRTPMGVLVFWPEGAPRSARLLDPARFEERARWERGTRASEGKRTKLAPRAPRSPKTPTGPRKGKPAGKASKPENETPSRNRR